jgi:uncharacterized membrane protein (DUF106 family)
MVNSRLVGFVGMLIVAMIAVQADAALSGSNAAATPLTAPEPSFLLLMLLAVIVAFATAAMPGTAPVRRRRVNRARLRARRARP